ncbi:MAG: hypothetical protein B0A82_14860 [Alkalinema sp. CACIAM 70d]|nr:MAG: hypothetical protein B0A82_14860 [Alkalinema sp. CACIAM 70d]
MDGWDESITTHNCLVIGAFVCFLLVFEFINWLSRCCLFAASLLPQAYLDRFLPFTLLFILVDQL